MKPRAGSLRGYSSSLLVKIRRTESMAIEMKSLPLARSLGLPSCRIHRPSQRDIWSALSAPKVVMQNPDTRSQKHQRHEQGMDRTSYVDIRRLEAALVRSAGAVPACPAMRKPVRRARPRGHLGGRPERVTHATGRKRERTRAWPSGSRAWHSHAGIGAKAEQDATSAAPETSASLILEGRMAAELSPPL